MRSLCFALIILSGYVCIYGQEPVFRSESFSLFSDRVIQGEFQAKAFSANEIHSNYKSPFKKNTSRNITLKFSLNSLDNERKPGQDHHFILSLGSLPDTAYYSFGKSDPKEYDQLQQNEFLDSDKDLVIKLDMRSVLNDFKTKGYFETFDGSKINASEFSGVYVAGGTPPLDWDFPALKNKKEFTLLDPDKDGIYEITIHFKKVFTPIQEGENRSVWKLKEDISRFPHYESPDLLIDALHNLALEEMIKDIRPDGAFMAGAKWEGVWTRDISYSIFLSLAIINPDACKTSLLAKVKNGKIIQDTGTGGAWPVSSDRMTWALAAWEIFNVTGDKDWLKKTYEIIKNSAEADLITIYDRSTGLMCGESSFLDWREQTYPVWMDPKDIYKSKNLGTNAVHYQTYKILSKMAHILGEPTERFDKVASGIKSAMNKKFWMNGKGYFGQYLYGREYLSLSPRSEALGEALCVLFDVSSSTAQQKQIVSKTPVQEFGIPCVYPQTPQIPPYHNNAVWPFVESFWALASAKVNNASSVERAMASVYRAAALFLTNKENMVASTGDHMGTEINSDRQLWSLAGNLALTYRIIFGMQFNENYLLLTPYIPEGYSGKRTLTNFKYRNSTLSITIIGSGNQIGSFSIDGKAQKQAIIPGDISGIHSVVINMKNNKLARSSVNLEKSSFTPETPLVEMTKSMLRWGKIENAVKYVIYKNGKRLLETQDTSYKPETSSALNEYQVLAVDKNQYESFLCMPIPVNSSNAITFEAELQNSSIEKAYMGFQGEGYILLSKDTNRSVKFHIDINRPGEYSIDFRYSNGNGPINTDNKCAIRNLVIDGKFISAVVFPQRGDNNWTDWGFSNSVITNLTPGSHSLELNYDETNDNMNGKVNSALLDELRITALSGKKNN
ncbi:MAG: glycogen debranching protein [Bacteroidota bacterium]|nr:glycogen debranching protein [Bacteroidota bacterium]